VPNDPVTPPRKRGRAQRIPKSKAEQTIDLVLNTCGRVVRGCLPLALAGFGGIELFDPALLPNVHMSPDLAQTLFGIGLGSTGIHIGPLHGQHK